MLECLEGYTLEVWFTTWLQVLEFECWRRSFHRVGGVFQNHSHPHWPVPLAGGRYQVSFGRPGSALKQPVPSTGGVTLETRCGSPGCLWAVMETGHCALLQIWERWMIKLWMNKFLFFSFHLHLFLACTVSLLLCMGSCGEWGLLTSCGVRASHWGGSFYCCGHKLWCAGLRRPGTCKLGVHCRDSRAWALVCWA